MEEIKHKVILSNNEAYAIIRAILCLYSVNKSPELMNSANEKTMGPVLKKAFGLSDQQYNEISEKILEYSTEEITISELQLRYAWKDNHPIYKSKAFKNPDGHTKWQKKEFQDIKKLLKDPSVLDLSTKLQLQQQQQQQNNSNNILKPSIQEIFNITLKKHTIEKSNGGKENIHIGYKILVNAFLQYSSQEVYREDRQHPIKSSLLKSSDLINLGLLPEFTWILNEYSILYGIRDFYRYLVIFEVLTTRFDDNLDQLILLENCFQKLQSLRIQHGIEDTTNDEVSDLVITEAEEQLFNQISSNLFNNLLNRIGKYRICFTPSGFEKFPLQNTAQYQKIFKSIPLSFALKLMNRIVSDLFSDLIDFQSVVKKAIIEANEKEFSRSMENFESLYNGKINFNYSDIFLLSKVINDIIEKWFDWEMYYFDLTFCEFLQPLSNKYSIVQQEKQKQIHLNIVFETFSKFINLSVSNIYKKYQKEEHTVRNNKTNKLEAAPWITCLFSELVPVLIRYNDISNVLFKKKPIPLEGEISFLTGHYILNRVSILNTNINHLIKKQEWKPNGKGVFHTSCPIDLFEFITQCYGGIQRLEIKLSIPSNPMTRAFGTNLGDTFLLYVKGIRSIILQDIPSVDQQKLIGTIIDQGISNLITPKQLFQSFQDNIKLPKLSSYNITEKMCLQINDIEHSRSLLLDFHDKYDNIFKDSLNELFTTLKDHWNSLLTFYVYKMFCFIKPIIQNISLSINENSIIISTRELINFIEFNLSLCNKKMEASLFPVLLKRLFQCIIQTMLEIILPVSIKNYNKLVVDRAIENFKVLMDDLTKVFHGEGDKTSSYFDLTLDDYNRIKKVMELYSFESIQLIDFHQILLKSQSKLTINDSSNSFNLLSDECLKILSFKRFDDKEIDKYFLTLKIK